MTSLRGIFVSESTFYEFIPCDLLKMFLFFKFIHSIKLRATWLRTHDFGRDDFRATWPVTFSYIFFKRLSCCRLNANFMLQMLKKLNCLWFAKKWILFPSNFCLAWLTWWLAWLAWLTGSTRMIRWLAGSQFVKTLCHAGAHLDKLQPNRNICCRVLLQKREFIPRKTHKD